VTPSATLSTPRLSDVARHLVIPEGIETSVFPRVQRRLNDAGVFFDPWQQGLNMAALGCRANGKYAASIGGVVESIPRQVGKTYNLGNLVIGLCLEFPGLRAAWTSHHNRTTTNTFRKMQGMVKRKQIAPYLAPNGIRTANGEQEIRFRNGSIIMFGAREQGFGRGLDEIDIEVFDEAQILTLKALEDMVPATNQARHPHGGLIFFLGTPPRPTDPGEAFTAKREQAITGKSTNMVYVEMSADPDADPDDRSQWPIMNPSYPLRTPLESMLRMRENIPDEDSWRREAMGIWPAVLRHISIVSPAVWKALESSGPPGDLVPTTLGVDMSHGMDISIAGCWVRDGFPAHIEEVWSGSDASAALQYLIANAEDDIPIVMDDLSPAAQFYPTLKAREARVRRSTAGDMRKGCQMFETKVKAGELSHAGQESVTKALMGARKREIGDAGGWGWDRRDSTVSIYPLVAATLALLEAEYQGEQTSEAYAFKRW
jgi:hypothetical protein